MENNLAIAISSGTLKGVFAQGVLSAFEGKLNADAYACASSSVISGSLACLGISNSHGLGYWKQAASNADNMGMSDVVLSSIREYGPIIKSEVFAPDKPRLMIAVSKVVNDEAAKLTQGDKAKKLGRKLLLQALRGDSTWVDKNLESVIFDSLSESECELNAENFDEVVYASTRMLHEWDMPAKIAGQPYVDASYTCACPVFELIEFGYKNVIVIDSSPGNTYDTIFKKRLIEQGLCKCSNVHILRPEFDLRDLGVDYTKATQKGIEEAYKEGYKNGIEFLKKYFK